MIQVCGGRTCLMKWPKNTEKMMKSMVSGAINQSALQVWPVGWTAGLSPWPMHFTSSADRSKRPVLSGNHCRVWAKMLDIIRESATEGHRRAQFMSQAEFDVWSRRFLGNVRYKHTQTLHFPHWCARQCVYMHEYECVYHIFFVNIPPMIPYDTP